MILRWTVGHFVNTPRHDEIEVHLAGCAACGLDLDISLGICDVVTGEQVEVDRQEGRSDPMDDRDRETAQNLFRLQKEAHSLLAGASDSWGTKLLEHPDREAGTFLWQIADRTVWYADEDPAAVVAFVKLVRPLVEALPGGFGNDCHFRASMALLGLAEGVALRTRGEHVAALGTYDQSERYLTERALSTEYARLNLARAVSFCYLDRLDEADYHLQLARQGFARLSDMDGEAKTCWELGSVLYQKNEPDRALMYIDRAIEGFSTLGDDVQASRACLAKLGFLIAADQSDSAHQLVDQLTDDSGIHNNPYEQARFHWLRGRLAALDGEAVVAVHLLRDASRRLKDAGAIVPAAWAMLDLAHVAGSEGDFAVQGDAAREAVILLQTTEQQGDLARGVAELHAALRSGVRIAEALAELRKHLRRA